MEIDQSLNLKRQSTFDKVVLYSATLLFTSTIALVILQVFVRVLGLPTLGFLHWTQPAARYGIIIVTYFGAAVALRNNEHISIRFLLDKLSERNQKFAEALHVIVELIVIGFLAVALRGTLGMTIGSWTTSIGGIGFVTTGHVALGITLGLSLMFIYSVQGLVSSVRTVLTDETAEVTAGPINE